MIDIFILVFSIILIRLSRVKFFDLNPVSIFIIVYVFYILIGAIVLRLLSLLPNLNFSTIIHFNHSNYYDIYLIVLLNFFAFSLGAFVSHFFLFRKRHHNYSISLEKIVNSITKLNLLALTVLLFEMVQLIIFFYLYKNFGLILLSSNIDEARQNLILAGGWKFLVINYSYINTVTLSVSYFLFLSAKSFKTNNRILIKTPFFLSIFITVTSLAFGFRAYLINSLLILAIIYTLYDKRGKINVLSIFLLATFLFVILTIYKYRNFIFEGQSFLVFSNIIHRLFFEGLVALDNALYLIKIKGYLLGKSYIMDLYSKLPGQQITFGGLLGEIAGFPEGFAFTPTLPVELYANFGWGSLIITFVYSITLCFLTRKLLQSMVKRKKIRYFLYYIIVCMMAAGSVRGGLIVIFDYAIVFIIGITFLSIYEILRDIVLWKKRRYIY